MTAFGSPDTLQVQGLAVRSVVGPLQGHHELLHQVDQEKSRADHQLGQTLQLNLVRPLLQVVSDLRQHVEHGGGQEHSAAEAREDRGDDGLPSSDRPILEAVLAGRDQSQNYFLVLSSLSNDSCILSHCGSSRTEIQNTSYIQCQEFNVKSLYVT